METLHLDDHLLVIRKPAGLLAQPDHTGDPDVLTLAKERLRDQSETSDPFLGLVHRLDRPTSGLMVLARTSDAARKLSAQFRERTISKQYLAVVEGRLQGIGTWTDYIAKLGRQPTLVSPDDAEGKRARLQWQALARTDEHTLLQIQLLTGRPHQIRLQAADRGHPVEGDSRYGADEPRDGILLHHTLLRLDHPVRARRVTFTAAPPPTWRPVLSAEMQNAIERVLRQADPGASERSTERE
jgi:tRNA pseudouridine32 synthase/23S rRNA pseudouridine746 synthase/23S rRNA pseudouridine1911/1915/1917 synthase